MTKEEFMKLNPYSVAVPIEKKHQCCIDKDVKDLLDTIFSRQYNSFNGIFVFLLQEYIKNKEKK